MNSLNRSHPFVAAVYFLSVLLITMFTVHPWVLGLSLLGGILFYAKTEKHIHLFKEFGFSFLMFGLISITNPLFSHNGATPLFFVNGNPITLEAFLYGIAIATMVLSVVYWFKAFNLIMTSEKLLFLFGKLSSKIALLLSSALRFIPLLKTQSQNIRNAQKAMGLYASDSWTDRLKGTLRVYSALISLSVESAIDTGAAMKGRGYGLKGRCQYSVFSFGRQDGALLLAIVLLDGFVFTELAKGTLEFTFYPSVTYRPITLLDTMSIIAFGVLSLLPFILEVKEDLLWNYYKSKI